MKNCTNVCGITTRELTALGGRELEVRRPSGKVLQVSLQEGQYVVLDPETGNRTEHGTLHGAKEALRTFK